jgi:hypothetical protein
MARWRVARRDLFAVLAISLIISAADGIAQEDTKGKRCAAGTLTSLLKIGRDHLPVADAGDKDAPWNLFALSL